MAQNNSRRKNTLKHAAIGAIPVGAQIEGYKAGKQYWGNTAGGVTGAATTALVPFSGIAAGAYHGSHMASRSMNKNPTTKAKVGTHSPKKYQSRVKRK